MEGVLMQCKVIGIDLAKQVFQACGLEANGTIVFNKTIKRSQLMKTAAQWPLTTISMEACGSAHHWGRRFTTLGHRVVLLPPQHVKAFVKIHKSDAGDALAIAEATGRTGIHPVSLKSVQQQDLQLLNRLRTRWVQQRTRLINQIRGTSAEYGVCFPRTRSKILAALSAALEDANNELSMIARLQLQGLIREVHHCTDCIATLDHQLHDLAKQLPAYERLMQIPGFGPVVTTALLGSVGDGTQFRRGRDLAAWVGLIPRQYGSGGKIKLMHITKNGDRHLRVMLVHGARSIVRWIDRRDDALAQWLKPLIARRGVNCATVAFANKLARIAWNVLAKGESFEMRKAFATP
jgi:transposase